MTIATNPATGEVVFLGEGGEWQKAQTAVNPQTKEMLAFDGTAWKAVPASKGVFDYVEDFVRSAASGATFGWMDEISAKLHEFVGSGTYDENVKRERARDAQIPLSIKIPGEVAGAVGTTVLTAPLAAWRAIAAVGSRLPQAARFGALGAVEGAIAGAGGADEGSRTSGALKGAAVGAPVGAVAPSVVGAVADTARAIKNAALPSRGAAADIGRAMVRDELNPAEITARMAAAQAERPGQVALADVGGENVRGLVERIAQTPGAGRTRVIPALTARQEQQAGRISGDLHQLTGTQRTARQAIDDTIAERSREARPLYDEAISFDVAQSDDVVNTFLNAVRTGWGRSIINSPELRRTLQTEYGIQGAPTRDVLMAVIDAWKRQADDLVGEAIRSGNANKARVIGNMRDNVVRVVDRANPTYAEARNAWAGPSQFMDAINRGRDILSTRVSAEEVASVIRNMTQSEREGFRIGAVSAIQGKMGNDPARLADLTKYLRSPEVRGKVAAIMPTDDAANAWARRLNMEVRSSELTGRSLGNSATARRLAEQNDGRAIVGDLVMDALLSGPASTTFLRQIFTAGPRWLRDTLRSRTDRQLAELLLNPNRAADMNRVLAAARSQNRSLTGRPVAAAGATAGAINVAE